MIPLVMAAGAAIQAGGALAKTISGAIRSRKMQDAIANYDRQDLENAFRGRVGVSRMGADLQSQEMARATATSVDALASGGVRGMVGGIGRVQQANNTAQRQISADLDRQQQQIDMMAAQDDARIRQMQERREEADLAGMGRELNAGRQDMYSGIGDIGQTAMSAAGMLGAMGFGTKPPVTTGATTPATGQPSVNPNFMLPSFAVPSYQINASLMSNSNSKYNNIG